MLCFCFVLGSACPCKNCTKWFIASFLPPCLAISLEKILCILIIFKHQQQVKSVLRALPNTSSISCWKRNFNFEAFITLYRVSQQVLDWFWAKKLDFENVLRLKLRWKSRMPLNNRSKNQILLSNLTILMKIKSRKSCVI